MPRNHQSKEKSIKEFAIILELEDTNIFSEDIKN